MLSWKEYCQVRENTALYCTRKDQQQCLVIIIPIQSVNNSSTSFCTPSFSKEKAIDRVFDTRYKDTKDYDYLPCNDANPI